MTTIRPAHPRDTAALARLKLATFRETFVDDFAIPYPPANLAAFEEASYAPAVVAAGAGPLAGTLAAQAFDLRLRPRAGDTLHLRFEQTVAGGASAVKGGAAGKPVTRLLSSMLVLSRSVVERSDAAGSVVVAHTDSVELRMPGAPPEALARARRQGYPALRAEVERGNRAALAMFRRAGFRAQAGLPGRPKVLRRTCGTAVQSRRASIGRSWVRASASISAALALAKNVSGASPTAAAKRAAKCGSSAATAAQPSRRRYIR